MKNASCSGTGVHPTAAVCCRSRRAKPQGPHCLCHKGVSWPACRLFVLRRCREPSAIVQVLAQPKAACPEPGLFSSRTCRPQLQILGLNQP